MHFVVRQPHFNDDRSVGVVFPAHVDLAFPVGRFATHGVAVAPAGVWLVFADFHATQEAGVIGHGGNLGQSPTDGGGRDTGFDHTRLIVSVGFGHRSKDRVQVELFTRHDHSPVNPVGADLQILGPSGVFGRVWGGVFGFHMIDVPGFGIFGGDFRFNLLQFHADGPRLFSRQVSQNFVDNFFAVHAAPRGAGNDFWFGGASRTG